MVYLTWIVSLQQKTYKVCWSLIALTVLQVAVASVLTAGVKFGLGLGGFLLLTTWALTNLSARWPDANRAARVAGRGAGPAAAVSVVRDGRVGPAGVRGPGRAVAAASAVAVAVGLTIFLLTPRMWLSRRPPIDPTRSPGISAAYTGFTKEVRLGALGEILESRAPAFDVEVERPRWGLSLRDNDAAAVFGTDEPLFRGRTLESLSKRALDRRGPLDHRSSEPAVRTAPAGRGGPD